MGFSTFFFHFIFISSVSIFGFELNYVSFTNVVCRYWVTVALVEKMGRIKIQLLGEYWGPASRAYLYYDDGAKSWADPLHVLIK